MLYKTVPIVETSSYKQAVSNADENSVLKKLIDEFGHQLNESSESISEGEDVKDFVSEEVLKMLMIRLPLKMFYWNLVMT